MSFEKDALLHEIQDQIDNFYRDNIVIPIYWREMNGRTVYDLEFMRDMFDNKMIELQDEHSKPDCYACATQRHSCEHDSSEGEE